MSTPSRSACPFHSAPAADGRRADRRLASHAERFRRYVLDPAFPCVGARSAANRSRLHFGLYPALGDPTAAADLQADLAAFAAAEAEGAGEDPVSFVAMFEAPVADEDAFARGLWRHLQLLHEADAPSHEWDASVSADPASPHFSFSVGGRAFFVVGLSPVASRLARRAPFPCLVFNFHHQFEALQASGKYERMQRVIRDRDVALQGDVNPMLARYGDASEARQYAGNRTDAAWACPFHATGSGRP